jgi:hypothetical protein
MTRTAWIHDSMLFMFMACKHLTISLAKPNHQLRLNVAIEPQQSSSGLAQSYNAWYSQ